MELYKDFFGGKRIFVTGAAGSVGKELVRQILKHKPDEIRLLDNNETELFFLMECYKNDPAITCFLGDVRDKEKLEKVTRGIDILFHCAAFKHVELSEFNPFDNVQTNVIGVQNIIETAINNNVKTVIFTSSDKAVNSTNVMGSTKLLGEKLVTSANTIKYGGHAVFSSTRFGNVIGSRGSVVPLFMKQIKNGGPVTVTNEEMTRFVMTVEESVNLVMMSATYAKGGEVFITKMPVINIIDLATVMIEILASRYGYEQDDLKIKIIGQKPGEKLYEELMSEEEMHRSVELEEMFVTLPAFRSNYTSIDYKYDKMVSGKVEKPYISSIEKPMDKEELKEYLIVNKIFDNIP